VKSRIEQHNAAHAQGINYGRRGGNKPRQDFHLTAPDTSNLAPRAPIILLADCHGTLSAVRDCLKGLEDEASVPIEIDIVSASVGGVTPGGCLMQAPKRQAPKAPKLNATRRRAMRESEI
jgi:hypothetical protein